MVAVSKSVITSSSAASIPARVCSRSHRAPKLFVPSPTPVTSGPPSPSLRRRMPRPYRSGGRRCGSARAHTTPPEAERTQIEAGRDKQQSSVTDEQRRVLEDPADHRTEQGRAEGDRGDAHVLE